MNCKSVDIQISAIKVTWTNQISVDVISSNSDWSTDHAGWILVSSDLQSSVLMTLSILDRGCGQVVTCHVVCVIRRGE